MKTTEFKKRIKELGLEIVLTPDDDIIVRNADGYCLAEIESERESVIEFYQTAWRSLPINTRKELSFILSEYVSTPIKEREEREDERLYYLKLKRIPLGQHKEYNDEYSYLNKDTITNTFSIYDKIDTGRFKTKFTERQIKIMDEDYGILKDYEMTEVE